MDQKPLTIGALWKRVSKRDNSPYYSGTVEKAAKGTGSSSEVKAALQAWAANPEGFKLLVFPNDKKGNDKAPDIRVLIAPVADGPKGFPDRKAKSVVKSASKADLF